MSKPKVPSIFSLAGNIYDISKRFIEDSIGELNESSEIQPSGNQPSKNYQQLDNSVLSENSQRNSLKKSSSIDENLTQISRPVPETMSKVPPNITDSPNAFKMYESLKSADNCLDIMQNYLLARQSFRADFSNVSTDDISTLPDIYYFLSEIVFYVNNVRRNVILAQNYHQTESLQSFQVQKKHIKKLEEALERTLAMNQSLELNVKNSTIHQTNILKELEEYKRYKIAGDEYSKELHDKIKGLNETINLKNTEIQRLTALQHDLDNRSKALNSQEATNDLNRLKQHLIETEENYVQQIRRLEEEKRSNQTMVQSLSIELNRTKTNLSEARTKYERHLKVLGEQLDRVSVERDNYMSQVVQLSSLSESNQKTINSLNDSLNDCQKEFDSQFNLMSEGYQENIKDLEKRLHAEKTNELEELKSSLEISHVEAINGYKSKIAELENKITKLQEKGQSSEPKSDIQPSNNGIDKILLKNLIIAHERLADEHKPLAWRVICDVLDVDSREFQRTYPKQGALSWIPIVNRFFVPSQENIASDSPSLSQLFVEYLEEESKKISVMDPYVPPISTDELKDLISRHQNSSL